MSYDTHGRGPRRHSHERHHHPELGPRGRHRHGRPGLHSSRKISSADLQLVLLALLEKAASHGYELIKSLDELSDGFYAPSPGMIYPALTYLEEIGYAEVEVIGSKKRYAITPQGLDHLNKSREQAEQILRDFAQIGARMEEMRRAFTGERDGNQSEALQIARGELKNLLRGQTLTPEEDRRIAKILREAVAKINKQNQEQDPEALFAAIAHRRSMGLSRLKPDPVDRKLIGKMLEAANWAPSHEDTEPWRFTVFMDEGREALAEIFEAAHREKTKDAIPNDGPRKRAYAAPVWISIGMAPGLNEDGTLLMTEDEELMAVACAVQNLHLMASALGLAGMWHSKGLSIDPTVAQSLGLAPPNRLLGFFFCGYPNSDWPKGDRRPLTEKVTWRT